MGRTTLVRHLYREVGINNIRPQAVKQLQGNHLTEVMYQLRDMCSALTGHRVSSTLSQVITMTIDQLKTDIIRDQSKFDNKSFTQLSQDLADHIDQFVTDIIEVDNGQDLTDMFAKMKTLILEFYYQVGRCILPIRNKEDQIMNSLKLAEFWVNSSIKESHINANGVHMLIDEVLVIASLLRLMSSQ